MRKPFLVGLTGLALIGCGPGGGGGPDAAPEIDPCQILADNETFPGYPFNFQTFENQIWPVLQSSCGTVGCHAAPNGGGDYNVWGPGSASNCPSVESFNAFRLSTDYRVNVANSPILTAIDGTLATHPLKYTDAADPTRTLLQGYIQDAFDTINNGGPGQDPSNFFDADIYSAQIQPLLDNSGCLAAGCHDKGTASGGFGMNPSPQVGSPEMDENFKIATTYANLGLSDAKATKLYQFSVNQHRGLAIEFQQQGTLEAWIQAALDLVDDENPNPGVGCVDVSRFNVGVFRDEIMPLLEGRVDYNDIDSGRTTTGCARSECHGKERGPGTFHIDPFKPVEQNLSNFSCFVDLQNPSASQVLVCPLDRRTCIQNPHPGTDVFFGVQDLNYQKVLAYLFSIQNGATPLDFAFFVRKINPMFNDPNAVQDGQLGLTCSSAGCHRSEVIGQPPDNGSNFGIIPEATQEQDLFINYVQAANFSHFLDATQSSLFLYPTNEIANRDNPLATGLNHPGGQCFDVDDQEAIDILKFTGGLRPNAEGFVQDVLVAGLFPATNVTDNAGPFDERTVAPRIFERSGQSGQFNQGQWDGFFSDDENIDLLDAFNVNDAENQLAYVYFNLINTTNIDIDVVVTAQSNADMQLFVGNLPGAVARDGQTAAQTFTVRPYSASLELTRVLLKLFQPAGVNDFSFTMQFTDDDGNLLTDATKELVFVLAGEGGGI